MNQFENNKPLKPVPKGFKHLQIFCNECKTQLHHCENIGRNGVCPFGHKQVYKIVVYSKDDKKKRKSKNLATRDLAQAMQETISFTSIANEEQTNKIQVTKKLNSSKDKIFPSKLTDCLGRYFGFINGDPQLVHEFKFKRRSKKHIQDVMRFSNYLVSALNDNYDLNSLQIGDIDDDAIDKFHDYLLKKRGLSARTYNKAIAIMRGAFNYYINEGYQIKNPFNSVPRLQTSKNIQTISNDEFVSLLEIIQRKDLGEYEIKNTRKIKRNKTYKKNWYKEFMKPASELGLYTGRRLSEIVYMKWQDVVTDNKGTPLFIHVEDRKVNAQKGNNPDNLKKVSVPVTVELMELLNQLGYEKYRGSSKYILDTNESMQREGMVSFISHSFSHYYKLLGTGKNLTFNSLRRTYISRLSDLIGAENARIISGHSSLAIMESHYISQEVLAMSARKLTMLDNPSDRTEELQTVRKNKIEKPLER